MNGIDVGYNGGGGNGDWVWGRGVG